MSVKRNLGNKRNHSTNPPISSQQGQQTYPTKVMCSQRGQQTHRTASMTLQQSQQDNSANSMTTLVLWNINKAMERNPKLDLRSALNNTQEILENQQMNVSAIVSQTPDERHLSCALLAWQQLGHNDAASLYEFVESKMKEEPKPQMSKPTKWRILSRLKKNTSEKQIISTDTENETEAALNLPSSSAVPPPISLPAMESLHSRIVSTSIMRSDLSSNTVSPPVTRSLLSPCPVSPPIMRSLPSCISVSPLAMGSYPYTSAGAPPYMGCLNSSSAVPPLDMGTLHTCSAVPPVSSSAMGPVLKLPDTPKTVPVYNWLGSRGKHVCAPVQVSAGIRKAGQDIKQRIEKACCMDSQCIEKLEALNSEIKGLRQRLGKLARREAGRIELLECADSAWRDLEMGYTRRLRICTEKEEEIAGKSGKLIENRNNDKEACAKLVQVLKPRGETAEKTCTGVKKIETEVCSAACNRLKMSEMSAKEDVILTALQCKSNQQDRDLLFKEEQVRRKKLSIESELESSRGLRYEAERTLKAELKGFKDQLQVIAKELLDENDLITNTIEERNQLLEEKKELTEDLEGCQLKCDGFMQEKINELKKKKDQLRKLKEQVLECKCKFPMEIAVQVKRTPSLAALCYCSPEDRAVQSCSCMSLRSRLLSDLFTSLFEGLQSIMDQTAIEMPCQLLKCFEDKFNWDTSSVTKSNLRRFFAKLLCGELEIAIANSIEQYHAKWAGATCADIARPIPTFKEGNIKGWEDRALAQKAQWMAEAMAQEMFNEKVQEVMDQAKQLVSAGPPPCTCNPPPDMERNAAVFQCICEPVIFGEDRHPKSTDIYPLRSLRYTAPENEVTPKANIAVETDKTFPASVATNTMKKWAITPKCQKEKAQCNKSDVLLLSAQIQELKKESLKRQDLKLIEKTIKRLVQRASGPDSPTEKLANDKENPNAVNGNPDENQNTVNKKSTLPRLIKTNRTTIKPKITKQYAVNMCFCGQHKHTKSEKLKIGEVSNENNTSSKKESTYDEIAQISTIPSKPIGKLPSKEKEASNFKICLATQKLTCGSHCACFNKIPSSSSIDKFLDTLAKWKCDINESPGMTNPDETLVGFKTTLEKNVENYSSKINVMPAVVCHPTVTKCFSEKFNELNNSGMMSKTSNECISRKKIQLPAATSEYMGAVNLDKSNENFSKCVLGVKKKENDDKRNAINAKNDTQDASFCKCIYKLSKDKNTDSNYERKVKSEQNYQNHGEFDIQRKIKSQDTHDKKKKNRDKNDNISLQSKFHKNKVSASCKSVELQEKIQREISKPVPSLLIDNNFDSFKETDLKILDSKQEPFDLIESIKSTTKQRFNVSDAFTCGCEQQIKLLGVTLANIKPVNKIENLKERNNDYPIRKKCHEEDNMNSSLAFSTFKSMEYLDILKNDKIITDKSSSRQPLCDCNIKLDQINDLLGNINKNNEDSEEDKKHSAISHKDDMKDENCVCCENSKELEVNVFLLLKEHLKNRLEVLKNSQSSYSITPVEEDMLVSGIFSKIKQTISESTKKIVCKCSEEASKDGSWQRAYDLLKEYLKIKMSRVQCTCSSLDQVKEQTILPELTDKVCLLIEKDFERLKDIHKFKSNVKSVFKKSSFIEEMKFQMPEKDTDEKKSKNSNITVINSSKNSSIIKELSKNYVIATNNISVQVIPNFETTSCEAINTSDLKSTIQTQSSLHNYLYPEDKRSVHYNLLDVANYKISPSSQDMKCKQESKITPNQSIVNEVENKTGHILSKYKELEVELKQKENPIEKCKTPYIGYTIECTCPSNLSSCVCSKSNVFKYNDAFEKLWSTYKKNTQNTSYIMENINKNKIDANLNLTSINITSSYSCEDEGKTVVATDMITNTLELEIITLKDSCVNLNKQTTQGSTNTEDDMVINSEADKSNYRNRCEPLTNEPYEPPKKKSVHFLYRSRSEMIATGSSNAIESKDHECECSKVPVCHVKMLMENIENKLANSECTCDSLSPKVCPVHSKKDA